MSKITINLIGSCVAVPIIKSIPDFRHKYRLLKSETYDYRYRDKLSVNNIPPGKIAARLYDDMFSKIYKDSKIPNDIIIDVQYQFEHVVKSHSINKTIDYARLNTGPIYVDLMYEFVPSVVTDDEEFMIRNNYWAQLYIYFPDWFNDIVRKNIFQFDMFDRTMTMDRHHRLRDAVALINSIDRSVVALSNVFTNNIYSSKQNCVIQNLEFFNKAVPFLKVKPDGALDPLANYEYCKDHIDRFFEICQRPKMSPGWNWVNVEELCYADINHEWGVHPLHLHSTSNAAIARLLDIKFSHSSLLSIKTST